MKQINPYILLCISIFVTLLYGVLRNVYSKKYVRNNADLYLLNVFSNIFSVIIILISAGGISGASLYTVILGLFYGISVLGGTVLNLLALMWGPFSYTSVIISSSMLIPALSGAAFWNEPIGILQYASMTLILGTLILSVDSKKEKRKASLKWLLCCLGAFIFNGAIGVLQKMHQRSVYKEEINQFLLIAFIISTVFSLVIWFIKRDKAGCSETAETDKKKQISALAIISAVTGICVALGNIFNMYLSGIIPSVIFFPVVNGANVILSAIAGVIFFREKMSAKQWGGLAMGIIAILILCIA